ncbi:hypothetical protein BSKO_07212 [Bryopsis sp. KO-2023]|nr:hypothetical protein BSKO_07212 [Bryopsis sp. KO-2023]
MAELRKRRSIAEGEDGGGANHASDRSNSWQRSTLQQNLKFALWGVATLVCIGLIRRLDFFSNFFNAVPTVRPTNEVTSHGPRLVAVGDIHGDLKQAQRVLAMTGLVDSEGKWIGGRTTLVQTGDLIDRGSESMAVVKFFEELKLEAKSVGGRVHTLLGNHELMNLESKFHYVSRRELQSLGSKNDLQLPSLFQEQLKEEHWFKILQPGSTEEEKGLMLWWGALQSDAWFGDVLRSLPVGIIVGEGNCRTAFVHAGLTMRMLQSVDNTSTLQGNAITAKLNEKVKKSLVRCPGKDCVARQQEGFLLGVDGVVWFRGYETRSDGELCPEIEKVLGRLGAQRIVVGHNLQVGRRARRRCGGRIEMIDVGISRAYLGGLAAWECVEGHPSMSYPQ